MNAFLYLDHNRAAELRAEAARDRLARQARNLANEKARAEWPNLRALLVRLRIA